MKYIIPKLEWQDFRTLDNDIKIKLVDDLFNWNFKAKK